MSSCLLVSHSHASMSRYSLQDNSGGTRKDILAGRRLLTFFFLSLLGSWLEIESVWVTCSVCDIVYVGVERSVYYLSD